MFPSDCGCTPSATDICDHTVPTQVNSPVRGKAACFITSVEDLQANAIADTETPCSTCFEASTTGTCAYDYQSCDASDDIATFTDCIGALDDICRNECKSSCSSSIPDDDEGEGDMGSEGETETEGETGGETPVAGETGTDLPGGGGGESNTIYYSF